MHDKDQLKKELLSSIFGSNFKLDEHNREIIFTCPNCFHHNQKFAISLSMDVFHCFHCHFKGKTFRLIKSFGDSSSWQQWLQIQSDGVVSFETDIRSLLAGDKNNGTTFSKPIFLPQEAIRLRIGIPSIIAKHAFQFLFNRGITYKQIRMYDFRYCEDGTYKDRILVPSYDMYGNVNFFLARSIFEDQKPYLYPSISKENILFNELYITWNWPIIITEGFFDAISVGCNTIPLLGSNLSEHSVLFKRILKYKPKVILMLDNDEVGRQNMTTIGEMLSKWSVDVSIAQWNVDDPKDPGECNRQIIKRLLSTVKQHTQTERLRRIIE